MQQNSVEIVWDENQTVVRISENGAVSERRFDHAIHASAFAAGQAILGNLELEYLGFAVDGRPDLNLVVYNPIDPAVTDHIRLLIRSKSAADKPES